MSLGAAILMIAGSGIHIGGAHPDAMSRVIQGIIAGHLHPSAHIAMNGRSVRRPCFVHDNRTFVRIHRPQHRAWRLTKLRLRSPARADPQTESLAAFARAFAFEPSGAAPDAARGPLMKLGAACAELELRADELYLLASSAPRTRYITDVFQLRTLVDEVARAAQLVLEGR